MLGMLPSLRPLPAFQYMVKIKKLQHKSNAIAAAQQDLEADTAPVVMKPGDDAHHSSSSIAHDVRIFSPSLGPCSSMK